MPKPCVIKNCPNVVSERSRFEECQTCRNNYRYWEKRPPSAVVERVRNIVKYGARMSRLAERPKGKKHAQVVKLVRRHIVG